MTLGSQLWTRATARPLDAFAVLGAAAATVVIVTNALFLQTGAKSAPFVATPASTPTLADAQPKAVPQPQSTLKAADLAPAHTATIPPPHQQQAAAIPSPVPLPPRHNDPIADLIGSPQRVQAVQRVLSEYGYGQLKPSGVVDSATSQAIEKFEREHKLPVSGRVSDKLVSELAAMTGHPID
jgi:peptidoglycan hydrolase-like protein with peptidoglycan-binding domain